MKEVKKESSAPKNKEVTPLEELAIFPLKNGVIYPNAIMPITIGQEKSIKLVDDALVKRKSAFGGDLRNIYRTLA